MSDKKYIALASRAFAANLKKLRKNLGMTQEELGTALGVKKSCISNYEQGFSMPDINRLLQIATFFKVENLSELLGYMPQTVVREGGQSNRLVPIVDTVEYGHDPLEQNRIVDELMLPNINLKSGEFFGFVVADSSMNRSGVKKGDIAIIRRQSLVSSGDIALVCIENQKPLLRKIFIINDETLSLLPDSEDSGHLPVNLNRKTNNFEILGRLTFMQVTF